MLADGLIEPSSSPYSSPIVMDKKKTVILDFVTISAVEIQLPKIPRKISQLYVK